MYTKGLNLKEERSRHNLTDGSAAGTGLDEPAKRGVGQGTNNPGGMTKETIQPSSATVPRFASISIARCERSLWEEKSRLARRSVPEVVGRNPCITKLPQQSEHAFLQLSSAQIRGPSQRIAEYSYCSDYCAREDLDVRI
jgi:hypothetical protein